MNENNFSEIIDKITNKIKITKFGVLATSDRDGNISACQMCIISDGLDVYFQTDSKFEKIKNIKQNPKVAINLGDYYFKGFAEILGHPTTNANFIKLIQEKHPETYKSYTNLKDEVLIKVNLTECKIWGVDNSKSIHEQETIMVIDLKNKKTEKINCDKM